MEEFALAASAFPPLAMAARGYDPRPNAGMCVAYLLISSLGAVVFFAAGDWPVGVLFIGLALIYTSDFFASIGSVRGLRSLGFCHILTGG